MAEPTSGQRKDASAAAQDRAAWAAEVRAIAAIGRALADVSDATSRARVLRWATECFGPATAADSTPVVDEAAADQDPLDDLFHHSHQAAATEHRTWLLEVPPPPRKHRLLDFRLFGRRVVKRIKRSA